MSEIDIRRELTEHAAQVLINQVYIDIDPAERQSIIQKITDIPLGLDDPELPIIAGQKFFYQNFNLGPRSLTSDSTEGIRERLFNKTGIEIEFYEDPSELCTAVGRRLLNEVKH